MKVIKGLAGALGSGVLSYLGGNYWTIRMAHLIEHATQLCPVVEQIAFLSTNIDDRLMFDLCVPKVAGEVLLTGSAYSSTPRCGSGSLVRVKCGVVEKRLHITGNRTWNALGQPSEPEPFVQMPLTWENAYGGPDFPENPLGKGHKPIEVDGRWVHPLPNIELPKQRVRSPSDRPEPSTFGPVDFLWPQRQRKRGTYDQRWLKERYPGYPDDIDWSIFNIAPEDQQHPNFFKGDEPYRLEGLHPTKPVIEGHLPGLRARCFVTQKTDEGEVFREVTMRLSTVWFFPDAERTLLIFHGAHPVAEDDAADILHLVAGLEALDEDKPVAHYQSVLRRRLDPEKGAVEALQDRDLLPADPRFKVAPISAVAEMEELMATEDLQNRHARARAQAMVEEQRAKLEARGLKPEDYGVQDLPPEEPAPGLDELPAFLERMEAEVESKKAEMEAKKAEMEAKKAEADEKIREMLRAQGKTDEDIDRELNALVSGPPDMRAEVQLARMQAQCAQAREKGMPMEELERWVYSGELREQLEQAEVQQREAYRMMAHHQDAPLPLRPEHQRALRVEVEGRLSRGQGLEGLDLTGADLSGLDLSGLTLRGAWMEGCDLSGARLVGADLSEAVLARATLHDTDLTGATLHKVNFGAASLRRAVLDEADLREAIFYGARLEQVLMRRVQLEKADWMEVELVSADLEGASMPQTTFLKLDLRGLRLARAKLEKSVFLECDVRGMDLAGAELPMVTFIECQGEGARFGGAHGEKLIFVKECQFAGADLRGARLPQANFRGTALQGADLRGALLDKADLSSCDLRDADLRGLRARDGLFIRADLRGAKVDHVDWMNAVLQKSDLRGADLHESNLYGADLAQIHKDRRTRMETTNLERARLIPERRPPARATGPMPWEHA